MSTPPIAFAVLGGDLELVKKRVESGADINEVTDKGTALHVACIYKREVIGRYLLENGANPRAKDKFGQMPIDVADDAKMVALLREYGIQDFGIHEFNTLQRDGQQNALILGNRNDVNMLAELLDPIDNYHGFYVPSFSLPHLHELEDWVNVKRTTPNPPPSHKLTPALSYLCSTGCFFERPMSPMKSCLLTRKQSTSHARSKRCPIGTNTECFNFFLTFER